MQNYISLVSFTEEGFKHLKETAKRARAFRENASKKGINIKETYWTIGQYDIFHLFEAPNHEAAASVAYALGSMGNCRTITLRAFTADEMAAILGDAYELHVTQGALK